MAEFTKKRAYSGGTGSRKPYGEKPEGGYKRKEYGDRKPYGEKPEGGYKRKEYGDRKPYGEKPEGGYKRKEYGDRKPYGEKPEGGYKRKEYGDRKPYGEKPEGGYKRKEYGDRKPYGEKPEGGYGKPFEKKQYDKTPKKYEDKPETENVTGADELPFLIMGRNAVKEAIKSGRSINSVLVIKEQDGSLKEVVGLARDNSLLVKETEKSKLDELCMPFGHGGKTGNHQGIVAMIPGIDYCEISDILDYAENKNEKPFVILLDCIEDPHNLGSIIRSAECAGAHGVIIPKRRSAPVTAAVGKASAGATEHMRIARVSNLSGAIDRLKDAGMWIVGADMKGQDMSGIDLKGAIGMVIGNEGDGLSANVKKQCDFLASIPITGAVGSLNAGVAAGILMFEKKRQERA